MITQAIAAISVAIIGVSVTTCRAIRKNIGIVPSTTVLASPTRWLTVLPRASASSASAASMVAT
jgi:hypothetical protein